MKHPVRLAVLGAAILALAACETAVQTSSGIDYLARYPAPPPSVVATSPERATTADGKAATPPSVDDQVRQAAAIEPAFRLPARIGLARMSYGRLVAIPEEEAAIWRALAERLGADWGEFVAINPLVAEFAYAAVDKGPRAEQAAGPEAAVNRIRIGAARQHADLVLVYETEGHGMSESTLFAVGNLTLIGGYLLPGKQVKGKARAAAALIDVRSGYPYGTALGLAEDDGYSPSFTAREKEQELAAEAQIKAVTELAANVEKLATRLAVRTLRQKS